MNLREEILQAKTKAAANKVCAWIGPSQERYDEVVKLFMADEMRLTQRAAWIVSTAAEPYPYLFEAHLELFIKQLLIPDLVVVKKRNILRILQFTDIPEEWQGYAADICFRFLGNVQEPIAVRAFAMTVVYNIGKKQPDLLPELRLMIEDMMPHGSSGIKARGRKILKEIDKIVGPK